MSSTELRTTINKEAYAYIDKPMPELTEWAFDEFYRNGNRVHYEKLYFERRKMLAIYGLKAIFDGEKVDPETLDKLNYVLFEVLSEDTWALPAHVNKYADDAWENTIDLFACETASAVGLIYKYAGQYLPAFLKDCMLREVRTRVLSPFLSGEGSFHFEGCAHNWNAVCTGGIGIALLSMGEDAGLSDEDRAQILNRVKKSLNTYLLTAFSRDGVSKEGVGYYNYGLSFYLSFAYELKKAGDDSLFVPGLKDMTRFLQAVFLKNGKCVNFSDSNENEKILPGVVFGLREAGAEVGLPDSALAGFNDDVCYRFAGLFLSISCEKQTKNESLTKESGRKLAYFKDAQWLICESDNGAAMAVKGGHNGEPHNHNDVGAFIYYRGDKCIACDLGQGEYTADYFGEKRYDVFGCGSQGHNVPIVNGAYQAAGESYGADDFCVSQEGDKVVAVIHFAGAYPEGTAAILSRKITFDLASGDICVRDICSESFVSRVVSRMHSGISCTEGTKMPEKTDSFINHQGINEEVFIYDINAKESDSNEILTGNNYSGRIFCTSFSLFT